jgi:hypothetical protein
VVDLLSYLRRDFLMNSKNCEYLATLRVVVGINGEADNSAWWSSSFFSKDSGSFLKPVFTRTEFLSQCQGVTQAALKIHDEHIGTGYVYHLFRLPENIERGIYRILKDPDVINRIIKHNSDPEESLKNLNSSAKKSRENDVGPIVVGDIRAIEKLNSWHVVASLYARAFQASLKVYPYFVNKT